MDLSTVLILIIIGLCAGILSGIVGVGGGLIIIPLLMLWLGVDQITSQGTSIAVLLPPVGILAAFNYYQNGNVNVNYAVIIAIAFIFGGYFGSKIALYVNPSILKRIFACIMLLVSIKIFLSK